MYFYAGKTPCKDNDRYWNDVSISHKALKIGSKPPETRGEARDRFFLTSEGIHSEGINAALILDFWPPKL